MLDIQAIPAIKDNSCLPIISDPSHACFWHKWVRPLSLASLAAGAEGLMLEIHPDPRNAAVDPLQAINLNEFSDLIDKLSEIAKVLRGKHKPNYTPHVDTGDYIVVINAEKIRVTGNKLQNKMYHRYTGYIGNLKSISLEKLLQEAPERVLQYAVRGMLPRNSLGRKMLSKLKIFIGSEHRHEAQQPLPLDINV